jgi:hypothetical protein
MTTSVIPGAVLPSVGGIFFRLFEKKEQWQHFFVFFKRKFTRKFFSFFSKHIFFPRLILEKKFRKKIQSTKRKQVQNDIFC